MPSVLAKEFAFQTSQWWVENQTLEIILIFIFCHSLEYVPCIYVMLFTEFARVSWCMIKIFWDFTLKVVHSFFLRTTIWEIKIPCGFNFVHNWCSLQNHQTLIVIINKINLKKQTIVSFYKILFSSSIFRKDMNVNAVPDLLAHIVRKLMHVHHHLVLTMVSVLIYLKGMMETPINVYVHMVSAKNNVFIVKFN